MRVSVISILYCLVVVVICEEDTTVTNATSVDPLDLCKLAQENVSLASLDKIDYFVTSNEDGKIYLAMCHPLKNLPDPASSLCDPQAYSCITKVNETGGEFEYMRNAGSKTEGLIKEGTHVGMEFTGGDDCVNRFNKSVGYKTRVDFFCNYDYSTDNSIRYEGVLGKCASQVFWHTSLACLPGQLEAKDTGSCVIKIPGYDITLDLSAWAKTDGDFYQARSIEGKNKLFQLNLCNPVKGGACTNGSAVCEVDDTEENLRMNLLNESPKRVLSYDEIHEVITLKYIDDESHRVVIHIKCDHSALEPEVTFQSHKGNSWTFLFLTQKACFVPSVQCIAEDTSGNIYSLSSLNGQEWDVGVIDTDIRYAVKVCGSLPMSSEIPCKSQTGICTYKSNGSDKKEALGLGVMYDKPQVNEDQSISLLYKNGDSVKDPATNKTCNMSATINLICSSQEKGPRLQTKSTCDHNLVWETPAACPIQKTVSHDCTVKEPLYGHLFNLTQLHNDTEDFRLPFSDNMTFVLNVCGPLISCSETDVCLQHETDLSYEDGSLMMRYSSNTTCPSRPEKNITASFIFICHHDMKDGDNQQSLDPSETDCHYDLTWYTALACPPHEVVQCSVVGPKGVVDLSGLSLPHQNYHVTSDSGVGEFSINVCRSLVHGNGSHCPYEAAACFTKVGVNNQINANNLGQVTNRLQMDKEGNVFLTYKLGSVCMEPMLDKGHIDTTIYFKCEQGTYDTEPVFVENSNCSYVFTWKHAAACPVERKVEGNCTVTNPASGFTFNLTSLHLLDKSQYRWKGTYHHQKGAYQFNVCGPLVGSKCHVGSGMCTLNGEDMGKANANLMIEDGRLSLNYSDGAPCEIGGKMSTLINFVCPHRREQVASGNFEKDGPKLVRRDSKCISAVEFYTDLACDHQVHCEVYMENGVTYSLSKLRRHQHNYHVKNKNSGEDDFVMNICGPLVPADVPSSKCNPHGACSLMSGTQQVGLGKVQTSPYMGDNGHLVIDYVDGGRCGDQGKQWTTRIIFTCEKFKSFPEHPFGYPEHVSTDDCRNTFHFPTVLACNDTTAVKNISEPDSCQIFHDGISSYIDITSLRKNTSYKVQDEVMKKRDEYFEIQPCGEAAESCQGAICKVTPFGNFSLGFLNDFQYDPNMESVRLRYTEGALCNSNSGQKWRAKIYYTCDSNKGIGAPVIRETYDCLAIFDWRTEAFCRKDKSVTTTIAPIEDLVTEEPEDLVTESTELAIPKPIPVDGGSSWGNVFIVLVFILVIGVFVILYRKPEARERVFRVFQETRARMPVVLGGRGRDDSTLLVSNGRMSSTFGSLTDDDDFS